MHSQNEKKQKKNLKKKKKKKSWQKNQARRWQSDIVKVMVTCDVEL